MKHVFHLFATLFLLMTMVSCNSRKETGENPFFGEWDTPYGVPPFDKILPEISGARIGLITNQTGVNKELRSTIDILHERKLLCCLFSPEHGVRGSAQAGAEVGCEVDCKTDLPIYSLYGKTTHIQKDLLDSLDIIAFDIQDVGARFYTYISTLSYAMEDCAAANKKMLVFDRINPIGGYIEGTVLDRNFS